jgi:hypothetical protein
MAATLSRVVRNDGFGFDAETLDMTSEPMRFVWLLALTTVLHAYGYDRPTSPRIDELAQESVLFEQAHARARETSVSVYSFFTSCYPGLERVPALTAETPSEEQIDERMLESLRGLGYID